MQEEDQFTIALVRHRFGHIAAQIASSLIATPKQQIADIVKMTGLDPESVISALTAMMQHDVITCQGPHTIQRPAKASLGAYRSKAGSAGHPSMLLYTGPATEDGQGPNGLNLVDTTQHLIPPHQYEVTSNPLHMGEFPSVHLFGNAAAGFKVNMGFIAPSNSVHQSILPLVRPIYDSSETQSSVTAYYYSINSNMVRGLARTPFYAGLAYELFSADARALVEEFGFRGKMTIDIAFENVVQRLYDEQDHRYRLAAKTEEEIDPDYTAEDFNAMTDENLIHLSTFAFNTARQLRQVVDGKLVYLVDLNILRKMDEIELDRYREIIPRVQNAFFTLIQHYLITPSFGFVDQAQLTTDNLLLTPQFINESQQIDKTHNNSIYNNNYLTANNNNNNTNNNTMTDADDSNSNDANLKSQKRKLISTGVNNLKTQQQQQTKTNNTTTIAASDDDDLFSDDDDDLFDDDDKTSTTKRQTKRQKTTANNNHNNGFASLNEYPTQEGWGGHLGSALDMPGGLPERFQVYILNHDRWTLLSRGEIFAEYICKKVCPTAGLIVGALSFESLRQDNPSLHNEYTIESIRECFYRYLPYKAKFLNAVQKIIQQNPAHQPQEQPLEELMKYKQKTPQFTGLNQAVEYYFKYNITNLQIEAVLIRLMQDHGSSLAKERQYVYCVGGTVSSLQSDLTAVAQVNAALANPGHIARIPRNASGQFINKDGEETLPGLPPPPSLEELESCVDLSAHYVVHWDGIAQAARREYFFAQLLTKHGVYAQRIGAVLCDHSRLEEKQIADFGMIPKKQAKELLHTLLTEGFLELVEVPTSVDRLNPAKSFYLWGIDYSLCGLTLLRSFYNAFTNGILRLETERSRYKNHVDKMLVAKHMEVSQADLTYGRHYNQIYAKFMVMLNGVMKGIILFKDLCPR